MSVTAKFYPLFAVRGFAKNLWWRLTWPIDNAKAAYQLAAGDDIPMRGRLRVTWREFRYSTAILFAERGLKWHGSEAIYRGYVIRAVAFDFYEAAEIVEPGDWGIQRCGTLPKVRRFINRENPRFTRPDRWIAAHWYDATGWRKPIANAVYSLPWI